MNTDISITSHIPEAHTVDATIGTKPLRRKIARLPKPLRDLINSCLDDALPAREIIEKLQASTHPPLPYPISEVNISDWRKTGYQHYLDQQERLSLFHANREAALEMVAANDTIALPEATLQIIANQYFEVLGDFSPAAMKQKLAEDPLKYTRFLNSFARLVREIVHLRKHRDAQTRSAAETPLPAPNPKTTAQARAALFEHADAFFMHSPSKWCTEDPNPSPTPDVPSLALRNAPDEQGSSTAAPTLPAQPPSNCPSSQSSPYSPLPSRPCNAETFDPARAVSLSDSGGEVAPQIQNQKSKIENPLPTTPDPLPSEFCLDCRAPLPPLTPEGKRPLDRCENCSVLLPGPGLCVRPPNDQCHFCGAALPRRLPNGRRPRPTCHNCGIGLGRELFDEPTPT